MGKHMNINHVFFAVKAKLVTYNIQQVSYYHYTKIIYLNYFWQKTGEAKYIPVIGSHRNYFGDLQCI